MMKRSLCRLVVLLSFFLWAGCGGESGSGNDAPFTDPETDPCSVEEKNEFVYDLMTDRYLWYDRLPRVDIRDFPSPEALLEALVYSPMDKWSYVVSAETYKQYYEEGLYVGIGYGIAYDENGYCRVRYVYPGSPAANAGMKRGDRIYGINGKSVEEIEEGGLWDTVTGKDETGVSVEMQMTIDGMVGNITVEKNRVYLVSVLYRDLIVKDGRKIGYLVYNDFRVDGRIEIDRAFSEFSDEKIDELILDLRYNGGGAGSMAAYLASLIAGSRVDGRDVFGRFLHNDRYKDRDSSLRFTEVLFSLDLERLIVITTSDTCSASELIINGLRPYMEVVVIGYPTCGKPFGMYGYEFCDFYISPIEFEVVNVENQGGYVDGIPPDCMIEDDLSRDFGDTGEKSLSAALSYIRENGCYGSFYGKKRRSTPKSIERKGFGREIGAF